MCIPLRNHFLPTTATILTSYKDATVNTYSLLPARHTVVDAHRIHSPWLSLWKAASATDPAAVFSGHLVSRHALAVTRKRCSTQDIDLHHSGKSLCLIPSLRKLTASLLCRHPLHLQPPTAFLLKGPSHPQLGWGIVPRCLETSWFWQQNKRF